MNYKTGDNIIGVRSSLELKHGDKIICKDDYMRFKKNKAYKVEIDYRVKVYDETQSIIFPFDQVFEYFYTKK